MILERVELTSREGQEEAFAKAFEEGLPLLTGEGGGRSARFGRGVENPGKFLLLVEWDSLEAHKAFIGTPPHQRFGQLIGPHAAGGVVEHFDLG
ncbi:MAG: antibiotic biosynthesis monooxygenase family protein [Sphingobium sp.]